MNSKLKLYLKDNIITAKEKNPLPGDIMGVTGIRYLKYIITLSLVL